MRDLVVVRCGRASRHPSWTAGAAGRRFDVWACPYEDGGDRGDEPALARTVPGPKWRGLSRLLEEERGWRSYGYVWLPDDDLDADAAAVGRLFDACRERRPALAAPALAEGSQHSHAVTLRNRAFRARATTFVEIMAPCFRRDALEELLPTLRESPSGEGWGLDDAWGRLLRYEGILVVDDVTVRHDRPVGASRTAAGGSALRAEMRRVRRRFDACSMRKTLGGTGADGRERSEADPGFLEEYLRGYAWLTAGAPSVERRLRRDQAGDPGAWLAGAASRARRRGFAWPWRRRET